MKREYVILLHGLLRTSRSMGRIGKRLEEAGYRVVNLGYPSRRATIGSLAHRFIPKALQRCRDAERIHFVTHSMGGILLRCYLENRTIDRLGRVVMLCPPNKGSEIVDRLGGFRWFQFLNGPAGTELGTGPEGTPARLGPATFPLGVIAGNRSLDPVFSRLLPSPNDGKVSVERAGVAGMEDFLVVPRGHTFIMNDRQVINQIIHFLAHGRFAHSETVPPSGPSGQHHRCGCPGR